MPDLPTNPQAARTLLLSWARNAVGADTRPVCLSYQEVARLVLTALEEVQP